LFQWYLILLWQNSSKSISLSVWNTTLKDIWNYTGRPCWTGLVNGWYNIVTFMCFDWFILQEIFIKDGSFHLFIVSSCRFFNISTYWK
jgi:hypothetical protein